MESLSFVQKRLLFDLKEKDERILRLGDQLQAQMYLSGPDVHNGLIGAAAREDLKREDENEEEVEVEELEEQLRRRQGKRKLKSKRSRDKMT